MMGYIFVLGVGYVMGTKAGQERYHQILNTYRSITSSPVTKALLDQGRRKIANKIHPDTQILMLTELEDGTQVIHTQEK